MSRGRLAFVLALVALASGEECTTRRIVARIVTSVQPDGTIDREVRLAGSSSDAAEPLNAAWWRELAGVAPPEPARWQRVDEGPGWIAARGRFADAAQVPTPVGHPFSNGEAGDRDAIQLERFDLLVATRFAYREEYGDPFDETARGAALERATDRFAALIEEVLRRRFGAGADLAAVDAFLRRELPRLAAEARRRGEIELPPDAFVALGLPPPPERVPTGLEGQPITERETWWLCQRLAERLAAGGTPVDPRDVLQAFEDHLASRDQAAAGREQDDAFDLLGVYLWGVYGAPDRFTTIRFEWRLSLPGRLLGTNGVPDGEGAAAWSFPDERLAAGDRLMTADSVLLRREPLRALGARTKYDAVELDRLVELLSRAVAEPRTRKFLASAIATGELGALRIVPEGWPEFPAPLFAELAELLDPDTPPLPGP
ncbi:MAG: hypothetical protein MUE47_02570 [Acidobacteria bacterium]|nr:hypothetical protein [Acidobacteriota bacterium]